MLDMLMPCVPRTSDGRVDYLAFVNAVRFNGLPVQHYSRKLRHRMASDPDSPCGPSSIRWGLAPRGLGWIITRGKWGVVWWLAHGHVVQWAGDKRLRRRSALVHRKPSVQNSC